MTDNDNPFAPFERFMEQFGAQGTSGLGSFDVPMMPFQGIGLGQASGPLSPEAGTRQTVRQLYTAIEELTGSSGSSPTTLWQQYQDLFNLDASAWSPDRFWSYAMTTNQIWLHSLSQLLVEAYTLRLIHDTLITDDYRHRTGTQKWLWTLSQSNREELLLRSAGVDEELVEAMRTARERRNELLYDVGSWSEVDFETPLEDAQRYMRILDALDDLVNDGVGFQYLPDADNQLLNRTDTSGDDEEDDSGGAATEAGNETDAADERGAAEKGTEATGEADETDEDTA